MFRLLTQPEDQVHETASSGLSIKRVGIRAIRNFVVFESALIEMLSDSYQDPRSILEPELARCDSCYCLFDSNQRLESFFLTQSLDLPFRQSSVPTIYLGLSASRQDSKNTGSVRNLYVAMLEDARRMEIRLGREVFLWYTTATPSACFAAYNLFRDAEPRSDGSYTELGAEIMESIRLNLGASRTAMHPFVLKELYPEVGYTEAERLRISGICGKKNFTLLKRLGVEESEGDRLAFVCRVPGGSHQPLNPGSPD